MSVEAEWRELQRRRRRLILAGWGLTLAIIIGLLAFMLLHTRP